MVKSWVQLQKTTQDISMVYHGEDIVGYRALYYQNWIYWMYPYWGDGYQSIIELDDWTIYRTIPVFDGKHPMLLYRFSFEPIH